MKRRILFAIALLFALALVIGQVYAAGLYRVTRHVSGSVGGEASNGSYRVRQTVGQPVIGQMSSSSYQAGIGFWYGVNAQNGLLGDVSCDDLRNLTDALFLVQLEVGLRSAASQCPLPPSPPPTLFLPRCDVNHDGNCNLIDALMILQCEVGRPNLLCPASRATSSATSRATDSPQESDPSATLLIGAPEVVAEGRISLPITAHLSSKLGATTIDIQYDPDLLEAVACRPDPNNEFDFSQCNPDLASDTVRLSAISATGLSGDLLLGEITFQSAAQFQKKSIKSLTAVTFSNPDGHPIQPSTAPEVEGLPPSPTYLLHLPLLRR